MLITRRQARSIVENAISQRCEQVFKTGWDIPLQYLFLLMIQEHEVYDRSEDVKLIFELQEYPVLRTVRHSEKKHLFHSHIQWLPLQQALVEAQEFYFQYYENITGSTYDI
jgi:hypothetical protein